LTACRTIEEADKLLRVKTQRWRRKSLILQDADDVEGEDEEEEEGRVPGDEYGNLALLA
jgi:hypothetical protein